MLEGVTIFNFNDTYVSQDFYMNKKYQWINFTDLRGVNGYCDERSLEIIRRRLAQSEVTPINYIDSGNYHYITYLLVERIQEPFTLVLFDHHTDMQASLFGKLMSCGCWVKRTIDENPFLKEVIIVGVDEKLIGVIPDDYKHKVFTYGENMIQDEAGWEMFAKKHIHYNVYISVDKDVLDSREAYTNWDQGSLTLKELSTIYESIAKTHKILGIDICGEYTPDISGFMTNIQLLNNRANKKILKLIEEVATTEEIKKD